VLVALGSEVELVSTLGSRLSCLSLNKV
jgi:hypothetical protein